MKNNREMCVIPLSLLPSVYTWDLNFQSNFDDGFVCVWVSVSVCDNSTPTTFICTHTQNIHFRWGGIESEMWELMDTVLWIP